MIITAIFYRVLAGGHIHRETQSKRKDRTFSYVSVSERYIKKDDMYGVR